MRRARPGEGLPGRACAHCRRRWSLVAAPQVLRTQPDLFGRSTERLRANAASLVRELGQEQATDLLRAYPAVLRLDLSQPHYQAKLELLRCAEAGSAGQAVMIVRGALAA